MSGSITAAQVLTIGCDRYAVRPWLSEELADPTRWRQLEDHGRWRFSDGGIVGEWISDSPSLFFDQRIEGDYVWQVRATRLRTDAAFLQRFHANKHVQGTDPATKYNFNFWLRADTHAPERERFFDAYPTKLGTGWNGMGDDQWESLFTTVVWNPDTHWVRLRRSPGYVQLCESIDGAPCLPYDEPHVFTFAVGRERVRMYVDGQRVYDYVEPSLPRGGYIGLCVWLCAMRFDDMRLYEWVP